MLPSGLPDDVITGDRLRGLRAVARNADVGAAERARVRGVVRAAMATALGAAHGDRAAAARLLRLTAAEVLDVLERGA